MSDFTAPGLATEPDNDFPQAGQPIPDLSVGADVSDLAELSAELEVVQGDPVSLEVPLRPGWTVSCRTDFTGKDLDKWRASARDKRFVEGIDGIKFSALILGATCIQVVRRGQPVTAQGEPVNFAHPSFMGQFGTRDVETTVRKFFGQEGHVDAAARRLLTEAGWGEDVYVVDPTSQTM